MSHYLVEKGQTVSSCMYTRNLANHLLYTKTPTLMLMVLYMIMPRDVAQSRVLLGAG